jgi:chemotaxis protein histidine kinase CheA
LQALVYSNSGRRLALVVDQILDTVEARVTTLRPDNGRRLAESMVIDGKVTQILDLDALCSHLGTRA